MSLSIDSGSDERDIEAGDDDEEEGDEKIDNEKRMKEEEENKKAKERQAFLENLYVLICMIIIVAMAVVIVIIKINIFQTDPNITFIPLDQQVKIEISIVRALQIWPMLETINQNDFHVKDNKPEWLSCLELWVSFS